MLKVFELAYQLFCTLVIDTRTELGIVVPLRVICSSDEFKVKQVALMPGVVVLHWKALRRLIDDGKLNSNLSPE
jgi:hypothetical protein